MHGKAIFIVKWSPYPCNNSLLWHVTCGFGFAKMNLPRWIGKPVYVLQWRHNGRGGVSNHQCLDCLLNHLYRHRSKKTSKLRVIGLCEGNSPGPVNSSHKRPVTRKIALFDDVIMVSMFTNQHTGTRVQNMAIPMHTINPLIHVIWYMLILPISFNVTSQALWQSPDVLGPLLLTWINFNPSMDK